MWPSTIYSRLLAVFILLTVTVSGMYGLLVYNAMKYTEDDILDRRVVMEAQYYIHEYLESSGEARLPRSTALQSYLSSTPHLPQWLKSQPLGSRELHDREVHISVTEIPGTTETLYIVLSELETSGLEGETPELLWALVLVGVTVTLAGLALAVLLGKYISAPLKKLTSEIERFEGNSEDNIGITFHGANRKDEVGALSRAFTEQVKRLEQFIDREQEFTRYASHELRTPITVVLNSVAVLRLPDRNSERDQRSLSRIESSAYEMESLVSTFLYLGRESSTWVIEEVSLQKALERGLEKQLGINEGHPLKLEQTIASDVIIQNDEKLIQILIDNVLRNIFAHGHTYANISLNSDCLAIVNDIEPSIKSDIESRKPYGLEIIERIAQQCNLRIEYGIVENVFTFTVRL